MKRFILFAGENYYPSGGWKDLKGSFDTQEEAIAKLHEGDLPDYITEPTPDDEDMRRWADWAHIVDTETMKIVRAFIGNRYACAFEERFVENSL